MKKYAIWLCMELKRAAARLPIMIIEAIILVCVIGMIAFCGQRIITAKGEETSKTIVIVSQESETLTNYVLSFLDGMESVGAWCDFLNTDIETGRYMLENGKAIAMVVIPEKMMEGILYGENIPATLYLTKEMSGMGTLFEELAEAGVYMLSTAQGEVYATSILKDTYYFMDERKDMYADIDSYNLNIVLNRESLFRIRSISATGGETPVVYYIAAFMTLYLMLIGITMGEYEMQSLLQGKLLQRSGLPCSLRVLGKWGVTSLCIGIMTLLPIMLFVFSGFGEKYNLVIHLSSVLNMVIIILCASAILQMICTVVQNVTLALLGIGVGTMTMGYVSGCFLPIVLLPAGIQSIARYLPTTYMRMCWSAIFQGNIQEMWSNAGKLCLFSILCVCISICYKKYKEECV